MKRGKGLKLGVIGVGVMGVNHSRIASTLPRAKLAAVADNDNIRVKEIAEKYKTKGFTSYKDLLPEVDAIILATPTGTHYEIALDCLSAGKHLFIEKPSTSTTNETLKLIELAKAKGVILTVGFIERFNPAFIGLIKLIKKGKIIGLNFKRFSPFPERITDADVVEDMMSHDLDLLRCMVKDEIESIKAEGEKIRSDKLDRVVATIYFRNGLPARLEANRVFGIKTRKISATCEKAVYEADLLNKRLFIRNFETPDPQEVSLKINDQITAELTAFVKAIKTGYQPPVTGEDAYEVLRLVEEIKKLCS